MSMRLGLAISLAIALVLACGGKSDKRGNGKVNPSVVTDGVLQFVPADTPYFLVSSATPKGARVDPVITTTLEKLAPVVGQLHHYGEKERMFDSADPTERLLFAIARELRGKMSVEGLRSLGIDLGAEFAIFGLGIHGAARLSLGDPDAVRALIGRVLVQARVKPDTHRVKGRPYWKWQIDDEAVVLAAIDGNHLSLAATTSAKAKIAASYVTGVRRPRAPLSTSGLAKKLRDKYELGPETLGMVDIGRTLAVLSGSTTGLSETTSAFSDDLIGMSPECKRAAFELAKEFPRVVWGGLGSAGKRARGAFFFEHDGSIAEELRAIATPMPDVVDIEAPMVIGFGADPLKALDVAKRAANAIKILEPCGVDNDELDAVVSELSGAAPFVASVGGVGAILSSWPGKAGDEADIDGMLAIRLKDADAFHGLAKMLAPNLPLPGDSAYPMKLPTNPGDPSPMFAILRDEVAGASVGIEDAAELESFLNQPPIENGPLLFLRLSGDFADDLGSEDDSGGFEDPVELEESLRELDKSNFETTAIWIESRAQALVFRYEVEYR